MCIYIYIYAPSSSGQSSFASVLVVSLRPRDGLCLLLLLLCRKEQAAESNRPNRTEPNQTELNSISEPAGTGRGTEPNQTGPSHDTSEKRKPICFLPKHLDGRSLTRHTNAHARATHSRGQRTEHLQCDVSLLHQHVLFGGVRHDRLAPRSHLEREDRCEHAHETRPGDQPDELHPLVDLELADRSRGCGKSR